MSESKNDFSDMHGFEDKSNCDGSKSPSTKRSVINHVVILEHGLTGNRKEMGYVKEAIECAYDGSSENSYTKLLVHPAKCNEENSLDGIEAGGLRLAEEINNVLRETANGIVREYQDGRCNAGLSSNRAITNRKIAFSFLGNSMGGLYGRFAVRHVNWTVPVEVGSAVINIAVLPYIFATIATPHLGMKNMSYFKVPRFLEPLAGVMFGQSGNDLLRRISPKKEKFGCRDNRNNPEEAKEDSEQENRHEYNDIIGRLSSDPKFLIPLSRFSRRIAYANAFSTDIAVPTATAAFLFDDNCERNSQLCADKLDGSNRQADASKSSESRHSLHIFVPKAGGAGEHATSDPKGQEEEDRIQYACVRFDTTETTKGHETGFNSTEIPSSTSDMARNLDSLGWSKMFVDARPHIPAIWRRPNSQWHESRRPSLKDFIGETSDFQEKNQDSEPSNYSSAELKRLLSGNGFDGNTLPFGHSFIIASTRDPVHKMLYKSGRPLVDRIIAQEIVNEILRFVPPEVDGNGYED